MKGSLREHVSPRGPLSGYVTSIVGALAGAAAGVGVGVWLLHRTSHVDRTEDFVDGFISFILPRCWRR